MIKRTEILNFFTKNVINHNPFVFQKYGDGEIACIMGERGMNCDRHPYSAELGKDLINSFTYIHQKFKDVYTAKWVDDSYKEHFDKLVDTIGVEPKYVEYDSLLHTKGQLDNHIFNFIKALKNSKNRKIFIGPSRLKSVGRLLNINVHIEVPLVNAYSKYEALQEWVRENAKYGDIYIFSSGMMSKVLIRDIRREQCNTTCIDFGSSFDPIFAGNTRLKQVDHVEALNFYKGLI